MVMHSSTTHGMLSWPSGERGGRRRGCRGPASSESSSATNVRLNVQRHRSRAQKNAGVLHARRPIQSAHAAVRSIRHHAGSRSTRSALTIQQCAPSVSVSVMRLRWAAELVRLTERMRSGHEARRQEMLASLPEERLADAEHLFWESVRCACCWSTACGSVSRCPCRVLLWRVGPVRDDRVPRVRRVAPRARASARLNAEWALGWQGSRLAVIKVSYNDLVLQTQDS